MSFGMPSFSKNGSNVIFAICSNPSIAFMNSSFFAAFLINNPEAPIVTFSVESSLVEISAIPYEKNLSFSYPRRNVFSLSSYTLKSVCLGISIFALSWKPLNSFGFFARMVIDAL